MRKRSSGWRSVEIRWQDMILPGVEDPQNLIQNEWDQKFRKIECNVIVWYDETEMRRCLSTPGSAEYILPITLSTSVTPVSPSNPRRCLIMYLEAMIERVWRCTWRPWSSAFGDAVGGRDSANLETVILRVYRYTWWLWLSKCVDALGGHNWASLEMQLEAVIERDWRSTGRRPIWRR